MSTLNAWLARIERRHARRSDLAAALLLGEGLAYARQRLAPMLLRVAIRTALHATEIYLLVLALPFDYLAPLLGYRALVQIASTADWGALEPLRRQVREQAPGAARWTITRWLCASTALAALPALVFALRLLDPRAPLSLFDAYGFACFARLAADVYARTLHAGVFALRRVYRPLSSLVLADALELLAIIVGFETLGPWVLPLAILSSGVLDVLLSLTYTRRAYRLRRCQLPRISDARRAFAAIAPFSRAQLMRSAREIVAASVAHASTQLDAWLLLVLVRVDTPQSSGYSLVLAYYVLRPCLGFSAHWVRAFYFDLSRLEAGTLRAFRAHLARYLRTVGIGCAALIAVPGVIAAAAFDPRPERWALASLLPLAFARAVFAQRQLGAFVQRRYLLLVLVATLLIAGFAGLSYLASAPLLLIGAAGLLALGCALLPETLPAELEPGDGLAEWLHAVSASARVQLAVLRVTPGSIDVSRVARALASALPDVRIARSDRSQLLLATDSITFSKPHLIAASGGALCELWLSERVAGRDALQAARPRLAPALARALDADVVPANELIAEFRRAFATGTLIDLRSGAGRLPKRLLPRTRLAELLAQIVLACRQREATRRISLPLSLAVYAPAGRAELVFIVPRGQVELASFRARVREATLCASLCVHPAPRAGSRRVLIRWLATLARSRNARVLPS